MPDAAELAAAPAAPAHAGKAATLHRLAPLLRAGRVLPLERVSHADWRHRPDDVVGGLLQRFGPVALIVRSSAAAEDTDGASAAGLYESVPHVVGAPALRRAIDHVFASYGAAGCGDEVLVQPMARGVRACGVAMTRDPDSALPYIVVEYTVGDGTDGVTSGRAASRCYVALKGLQPPEPPALRGLFALLHEVQVLLGRDDLDIEFAITDDGPLLFQARPMTARRAASSGADAAIDEAVRGESARIAAHAPALAGPRKGDANAARIALFGVMPDWNPAEMIGIKPRPLAVSLYETLITDVNWASARFRYGYRDLRDKPLMFQFCGSPYVCIPRSVESFVPATLPPSVAAETVHACCRELAARPHLHDKIEFALIPTCYTPALAMDAAAALPALAVLSPDERRLYVAELKQLTEHIASADGPFYADVSRLPTLESRLLAFRTTAGTGEPLQSFRSALAGAKVVAEVFAGVARAAFVATALLQSLEAAGAVPAGYADRLIGGTHTVGRRLADDFRLLPRVAFLQRHGHVRPGTYDIRVPRYDEAPDAYFDWASPVERSHHADADPALDRTIVSAIRLAFDRCDLMISSAHFVAFARDAVAAREAVKYLYGAFVSEALKALAAWGSQQGLTPDDLSFATLADLHAGDASLARHLRAALPERRSRWHTLRNLRSPMLICDPADLAAHELLACRPSFITRGESTAETIRIEADAAAQSDLSQCIALIESADPGYDWIFTHRIAGFITAYGGENSHMAIRAREFGVPAAIGVGDDAFRRFAAARRLRLDCAGQAIQVLA